MTIAPDQHGSTPLTTGVTSAIVDITTAAVGSWVYVWAALSTGATTQITVPSSAGWTQLQSAQTSAGTSGSSFSLYRRQKQLGDTTFTFSWATSAKGVFAWASYTGLDGVTPDEQSAIAINDVTSRSAVTTPTATPTTANEWALCFFGQRSTNTAARPSAWTTDAALIERIESDNSAAASSPWLGADIEDSNGVVTQASHSYTATSNQTQSHDGSAILFLIPSVSTPSYTQVNSFAANQPYPLSVIGSASTLVPQIPANIPNVYVQGVTATATVASQIGAIKTSPIVVTDLTNGSNTSTSQAITASISPAGNSLLLLWTGAWDGGTGNTTNVTSVSGLGLVWTQVTAVLPGSVKGQTALWYAITGPNPGSGTVTINLATASAICWDINQVTNVNLASPFVASNTRTNTSNSGNPNVTLNAAANAITNLFMFGDCMLVQAGASLTQSAAETPPWTVLSSQESNTANNNTACMVQVSPNTSTVLAQSTATAGHSWGVIGIELQASPAPVFSSVVIPSINPVFRLANKNLRVQNPASIPVTSATPVNVNGLTATVNVSSNFGSITVSETGTVANVNVAALTGNVSISAKPTTPNVPIASYPFGLIGKTLRQQNQANIPNVYVPSQVAILYAEAGGSFVNVGGFEVANSWGPYRTQQWAHTGNWSTVVIPTGTTGNIQTTFSANNTAGNVYQAQTWVLATQNCSVFFFPESWSGNGTQLTSAQNTNTPSVNLIAGVPTLLTSSTGVVPAATTVMKVRLTLTGTVPAGLMIMADDLVITQIGTTNIGSNFTQQFPVTTNVPYPLNVISRLRPQNSYTPAQASSSVNINGLVATENVAANFGSVFIFSPKNVPAPFANSVPYPLNIISGKQNPANIPYVSVQGTTAWSLAAASKIISYSTFESGLVDNNGLVWANTKSQTISRSNGWAKTGNSSLLSRSNGQPNTLTLLIPVSPDTPYQLSAWINSLSSSTFNFAAQFFQNGVFKGQTVIVPSVTANVPLYAYVPFKTPAGCDSMKVIVVANGTPGPDYYLDDVILEQLPGNVYITSNFQQQFPVTTSTPYPLNITSKLQPQYSSAPVLGVTNINVAGITATVNASATMGGVFKPSLVTSPVSPVASYPFRLAGTSLIPQVNASRPILYVQGTTATSYAAAGSLSSFFNFESGTQGWITSPAASGVSIAQSSAWSNTGNNSLLLNTKGIAAGIAKVGIPSPAAGTLLQISGWFLATASTNVSIAVIYNTAAGFFISQQTQTFAIVAGVPTYKSVSFVVPFNASVTQLEFNPTSGYTGLLYADDIEVIQPGFSINVGSNFQQPFPLSSNTPWPLPVIAKNLKPQKPGQPFLPSVSISGITSAENVIASTGVASIAVSEGNSLVTVATYPGTEKIGSPPVVQWRISLAKPMKTRVYVP